MAVTVYGIPGCDTVKKARNWLDAHGIAYEFRDYKKVGVDPARLSAWAAAAGWEVLLNKRGTTFRKLDDAAKSGIDGTRALELMVQHTSLIKRPVVEADGGLLIGFDPDEWHQTLA